MKRRDNISGICILGVLIILVLLPLVAVLFQIVCPGLQPEKFDIKNLSLILGVFTRNSEFFFPEYGNYNHRFDSGSCTGTYPGTVSVSGCKAFRFNQLDFDDCTILYSGTGLGVFCFR